MHPSDSTKKISLIIGIFTLAIGITAAIFYKPQSQPPQQSKVTIPVEKPGKVRLNQASKNLDTTMLEILRKYDQMDRQLDSALKESHRHIAEQKRILKELKKDRSEYRPIWRSLRDDWDSWQPAVREERFLPEPISQSDTLTFEVMDPDYMQAKLDSIIEVQENILRLLNITTQGDSIIPKDSVVIYEVDTNGLLRKKNIPIHKINQNK